MNHEATKITKKQEEVIKMELSTFRNFTVIAYFFDFFAFLRGLRAFVVKVIAL